MKVHFQLGSPLDRLETDPRFDAGLSPLTVTMYRRRMQQLRACLNEGDVAACPVLDMRLLRERGADFFSIFICQGSRLVIHLIGDKPRRDVAVLEIIAVKLPVRRLK